MSLLFTLFGGVVLVVLLYQILRVLGLPNYWRGVISGVLPLVGYAIYSTGNWAGLDVLAMHTAVYLSTATLLTLAASREASQKISARTPMHWAPKVFIGFFLFVLALNAAFLYVSSQGVPPWLARWVLPGAEDGRVHTAFPGVVPHGLEAAKEIGSELSARHRQMRLGWRVTWKGLDTLARDGAAQVTVRAHDRDDTPLADARVTLELLRPAQAKSDLSLDLAPTEPGLFQAWVRLPEPGRWIAVIHVSRRGDSFQAEEQLSVQRVQ
ncbi:FixH family protein [Thiobacter aerophilum]|uniref:FixH family protein n=1 Tax=Thiobacter aerophilum TaxID=3121275 RepID=A0ABV0EEI0_9BURK